MTWIRSIQEHALAAVHIQCHGASALNMSIAGKHREFAGRIIEVHPQYREPSYGNHGVGEPDPHLTGPGSGLHFKIAQAAFQHHFGIAGTVLPAQDAQSKRAVRRKTGHAAVFKLEFSLSSVGCNDLGPFKEGRVRHGGVRDHLATL
jgi:hypothetical protein